MANRKIWFPLIKDDDDYPPYAAEGIWVTETDDPTQFVIANIPFFTRDATLGDTIKARQKGNQLEFERVVKRSASSLIRVFTYDATKIAEIRAELKRLGCSSEWHRRMIAVDDHALNPRRANDLTQNANAKGLRTGNARTHASGGAAAERERCELRQSASFN